MGSAAVYMLVLSETLMKINKWITASLFIRIIDYLVSQIEHLKKCDRPAVISYLYNCVICIEEQFYFSAFKCDYHYY